MIVSRNSRTNGDHQQSQPIIFFQLGCSPDSITQMAEQSFRKTFKIRRTLRMQRNQEAQDHEEVANLQDLRLKEPEYGEDKPPQTSQQSDDDLLRAKEYLKDKEDINCFRFPHRAFCGCESNCLIESFHANQISPGLYFGGFASGLKTKSMLEMGVTHVLNITSNEYTKRTRYFEYLNIDLHSNTEEDGKKFYRLTNRFIRSALARGGTGVHPRFGPAAGGSGGDGVPDWGDQDADEAESAVDPARQDRDRTALHEADRELRPREDGLRLPAEGLTHRSTHVDDPSAPISPAQLPHRPDPSLSSTIHPSTLSIQLSTMSGESASSYRFLVQMVINIFLCKKAQEIIGKRVMKEEALSRKSYLIYVLFALTLFLINQSVFLFFKDDNLYQQIGVPRRLSPGELKQWGAQRRAEILKGYSDNPKGVEAEVKQFEEALNVLTHPARRLSYDSFGYSDVSYAWAFKSPPFILSTIIGSGFFFVICTVMSMMSKKKSDLKLAFKAEIFAMILLFIWQVDLIISTETRMNNHDVDFLDYLYTSFPIFERRQMLRTIIIPCMSLVEIFVRFYTVSSAEKRIMEYGSLDRLLPLTLPVRETLGAMKVDEHLEERVSAQLQQSRVKEPIKTEIFRLQRESLQLLLQVHREQLVAKQTLARIINYFVLMTKG